MFSDTCFKLSIPFSGSGSFFLVRPAAHVCLCGESPLTAREGEGLATRQSQGGNKLMKEADSK